MTFSIVAYDPVEQAVGVAVASKFPAVGAVVPFARAGIGAVATQANANVNYGPDGLNLLAEGQRAPDVLAALIRADANREHRQIGLVDVYGGSAAHTGRECFDYAGHRTGEGYSCQGNILTGPQVVDAMISAYLLATGELADRLVTALLAGDEAGGDRRGRQGAAVMVAKPNGGYGGNNDRYLDLRVDDHVDPVPELIRLVGIHHLFFGKSLPEDQIPMTEDLARELQRYLVTYGYSTTEPTGVWDDDWKQAFTALVANENLEERWSIETTPDRIDRPALEYLRQRLGSS